MAVWTFAKSANYEAEQADRVAVFNKIAPKGNWKNPIQCWIKEEEFAECNEAAIWFAGAGLTIIGKSFNMVHVTAPGYYAAVGA